jgi:hypothetical protein
MLPVYGQIMISDDENVVKIAQFQKIARDKRKAKAKKEKEAAAAANRVKFGRTGHEKKLTRRLNDKAAKAHEGSKREPAPSVTPFPHKKEPSDDKTN